jgi:hypothetical protein
MSNDLYFIPMIIDAFRRPDPRAALAKALARIRELGQDPAYSVGYEQFQVFMNFVAERAGTPAATTSPSIAETVAQCMAIELANGELNDQKEIEKAAEGFVRSFPSSRLFYRQLRGEMEDAALSDETEIRIEKDGNLMAKTKISGKRTKASVTRLSTGVYTLKLGTGRVIWEGLLEEKHLAWPHARPGEPLELAAATEEDAGRPTLESSLLGGQLTIRVFAGIGFGRMEIVGRE